MRLEGLHKDDLPTTVEELQALLLRTRSELITAEHKAAALSATVEQQRGKLEKQEQTILELLAAMRGKRRERIDPNQLLLFDLGDGSRLSARVAHQVTDVFISHAHMDHIGGFLWLLRSRLGDYPSCRLFGPPGLARHIEGFLQGILWDRIKDNGASFVVNELHGDHLRCFYLQAGYTKRQLLEEVDVVDGIILDEPGFRIRCVTLDHNGTPVIAYAFEPDRQINIRKDRLEARGLRPGTWLNELKQNLLCRNESAMIQLPDGSEASTRSLADDLVLVMPGKKLVYATDLADTDSNRQQLIKLAQHAHTFFCEAAFLEADADYANTNGHLTTRACGEIATEAGVSRLVPFHFSRRYIHNPQQLYDEIKMYCTHVLTPESMALFEARVVEDFEPTIELSNHTNQAGLND